MAQNDVRSRLLNWRVCCILEKYAGECIKELHFQILIKNTDLNMKCDTKNVKHWQNVRIHILWIYSSCCYTLLLRISGTM